MQDSLNKIKWRKDKKGYTVPNDELIKKILRSQKIYNLILENYV